MIYANIRKDAEINTGVFRINIALSEDVHDFSIDDCALRGIDGNGIEDVQFDLSGNGREYSLQVYPPQETCGEFEVGISREGITAEPRIFAYDTCTQIVAEFGEPVRIDGTITIPVSFPSALSVFNRGAMHVSYDSAGLESQMFGLESQVFGKGTEYEIVLHPRGKGVIRIALHRATKANGVKVRVIGGYTLEV